MAPQKLAQYVPQWPPTPGDMRRHTTTARVGQSGMWRHCPTPPDTADWVSTTAGCRFDSCPTCPVNPEFMGVAVSCPPCTVCALTPI
jgi:hypothetical protein